MRIELDGALMTDREALHDLLAEKLSLPDYYGRNLDALYDLLTERRQETAVCVLNWADMELSLGHYAAAFLDTLYDAALDNDCLHISVQ